MSLRAVIPALAIATVAFHLYGAGFASNTALVQRSVHLLLLAVFAFAGGLAVVRGRPAAGALAGTSAAADRLQVLLSGALLAGAVLSFGYLALEHEAIGRRIGAATTLDITMGALALVVVLELARRAAGWPLVAVAGLALGYAVAGPWLPGALAHRGYGARRLVEHLYLSTEGIWGVPLGVSADFVFLFILFGALLQAAGGGELLVALAARLTGRLRGGTALTATVASGLMGSLSGSAVANVATTGAVTIPLMRRAGFDARQAGAIEAAASTGGQLVPPVMGAGAFIMATWTNIPYAQVALAALLPALLYYLALLVMILFRAIQLRLPPGEALYAAPVARRLHLLLPLVAIVVPLLFGRSPMRAAFWGVVAAALVPLLRRETRLGPAALLDAVLAAVRGAAPVAAACAAAGIVVGVASLTGIGLRMSGLIVELSGGSVPIALLLTGAGSLVLGMGLPTTAAYVVLAALGAPALVELGVPLLAAHLFIFYFGCISNVTPPVSLAAFAAAGISGASPMRTAVSAAKLATAGFVIPFMFVYGPELLLDGTPIAVFGAAVTAAVGIIGLAAAVVGHAHRPLGVAARLACAAAALLMIRPDPVTDAVGILVLGAVVLTLPLGSTAGAAAAADERAVASPRPVADPVHER
jgi:TRAP transporter 4TM/12TM fusion protein